MLSQWEKTRSTMGGWEWLHVVIISSRVVGYEFLFKARSSEYKMTWVLDQIRGVWHTLHVGNLPTPVYGDTIFHSALSGVLVDRPMDFLMSSYYELIWGWKTIMQLYVTAQQERNSMTWHGVTYDSMWHWVPHAYVLNDPIYICLFYKWYPLRLWPEKAIFSYLW